MSDDSSNDDTAAPDDAATGAVGEDRAAAAMHWGIPLHDILALRAEGIDGGPIGRVHMPVLPDAMGSNGLHGGAIATLVDVASAMAAVAESEVDFETQTIVTTDMHLRYLGQPRTDSVTADATVIRAGKQIVVVECKVTDGNGHPIASADVGMMIVPIRRPLAGSAPESAPGS